jgi:hypothetical protein
MISAEILGVKEHNELDGSLISSPSGVPTSTNFFPAGKHKSELIRHPQVSP